MIRSASPQARAIAAAVLTIAPMAAVPATAQDEPEAAAACESGTLGVGGTFEARAAEGIVRAEIVHQCERTLDDGTYVPEGYRVRLYEACDGGACELPFMFAVESRNESLTARYDDEGGPITVRLRSHRNGGLIVTAVSGSGRGDERERQRYVLRPAP